MRTGVAMGLTKMAIMGTGVVLFQPLIGILAHARGQEASPICVRTSIEPPPTIGPWVTGEVSWGDDTLGL